MWVKKRGKNQKVVPDQHKITEFNQIFNITKLTSSDEGKYVCKACNIEDKEFAYIEIDTGMSTNALVVSKVVVM